MRLTESMRFSSVNAAQARASERLYAATRRASSGLKVETPSDDPAGYSKVVGLDSVIARFEKRKDLVGGAADTLDLAEGSLASAGDLLVRARELAVQMANGDLNANERATAAKEVDQIRESLLGLANTKGSEGYLFAGSNNATAPFSAAGVFSGNDDAIQVETSDGVLTRANASGARAFTVAGGRDVFADLAAFSAALSANDVTQVQASIDALDASHTQLVTARAEVGLQSERIRAAADITAAALTTLQSSRASTAEADPIAAYSDLSTTKSTYERALSVTAQILQLASAATR
jgi:flagellar hook-associated protein 3 FlgL